MIGKDTASEDIVLAKALSAWNRRSPNGTVVEWIKPIDQHENKFKVTISVEAIAND